MGSARFVLLVDDDREICEIITAVLALEGFAVKAASDVAQGLELAH